MAHEVGESNIVKAQPRDLEAILEIMKQANQYALLKSGNLLHVTQHADNMILLHIDRGDCFVIRNPDTTVAALITIDEEDTYSWDEQGRDSIALYFHKLIKNPQNSPPNCGFKLINFVAQEAIRRGKQFIRCDTKASMTNLISYYEKLGITKQKDIIYKSSKLPGVLLQGNPQKVLEKTAEHLTTKDI